MKTNAMSLLAAAAVGLAVGLYAAGALSSVLPLLLLLACPLVMIFMMQGMSGGGGHDRMPGSGEDPHDRHGLDGPDGRRSPLR